MRIPTEFQLFGETIRVTEPGDYFLENDYAASAVYRTNEIRLRPVTVCTKRNEQQRGSDFCHELSHFLLYHAEGAYKGDKDYMHQEEPFVDLLGKLLHQALTTMKYSDGEL